MIVRRSLALGAALLGFAAAPVQAAVIADSLPYMGTPDWTDVHGLGSSITLENGVSTLTAGGTIMPVYFGYANVLNNTPSWTPGTSATGNMLTLTAKFQPVSGGPAATDWTAYAFDGATYATMVFNPKTCGVSLCAPGVQLTFGQAGTPTIATQMFIAIDTSVFQDYGFLLKDGQVSYLVGSEIYSGAAFLQPSASPRTVRVGDMTPGTSAGVGQMLISKVAYDNAPAPNSLGVSGAPVSGVPEPATWAMMIGGLGLVGVSIRRRRPAQVLRTAA
jgi:hypothetical protein